MAIVSLPCTADECEYHTERLEPNLAIELLQMHQENRHRPAAVPVAAVQQRQERPDKFCQPEMLELEPTETNEAAYIFWKQRFEDFLAEGGIVEEASKYRRLKNRVKWEVFEHVQGATTYEGLIAGLDKLFAIKKNVDVSRNKLITSKQKGGETIQAYLLRLNVLARDGEFTIPATVEENKREWVRQALIQGLASSEMRLRILEREGLSFNEVVDLAQLLERSLADAQNFD